MEGSVSNEPLELWGGIECTVNRVYDGSYCQRSRTGHVDRLCDLDLFASLGIRTLRYPLLWERTAPDGLSHADWKWSDERLGRLRELGITPIAGLVHHGSGPRHTHLNDPAFAELLADYAYAVAARYPWLELYTPVNEPLTTARFSGLYGIWYPHARDEKSFLQILLNECRATALAMRAIRRVNPNAKLIQTDDLGKTHSTPLLAYQAQFQNELRWLGWDLLCGRVDREHALWTWIIKVGIDEQELSWFIENPCPPDVLGLNYYVTSERLLDERLENYPSRTHGGNNRHRYADIEASRALAAPMIGIEPLLMEAWKRYGLPLAVTESHIDSTRDDHLRWIMETWRAALRVKQRGADVRAVTVWALLGLYDWSCLLTECRNHYEPGAFDMRGGKPRATAVASLMRDLGAGRVPSHPVLQTAGWWNRSDRFLCPPVFLKGRQKNETVSKVMQTAPPILISGAGTLGRAFAKLCQQRGLAYRLLTRAEMDIADTESVERAMARYHPWAIINAAGYVRVDEAERETERCYRENTHGPRILASVCARHNLPLLSFSSDLVFDGQCQAPYVESDRISPLNVYGRCKAEAELRVLEAHSRSLIIRTSSFFGPWDKYNFITQALGALAEDRSFCVADDLTVSPTYVPDLVHACLDLLIDNERGIWHLTNSEPITWADFALRVAQQAQFDTSRLQVCPSEHFQYAAKRPRYSALTSERGILLPSLNDALGRYIDLYRQPPATHRMATSKTQEA